MEIKLSIAVQDIIEEMDIGEYLEFKHVPRPRGTSAEDIEAALMETTFELNDEVKREIARRILEDMRQAVTEKLGVEVDIWD
jgi:hypothetical protein